MAYPIHLTFPRKRTHNETSMLEIKMTKDSARIGIGIDVGSSSARVGIYNYDNDALLAMAQEPVPYYQDSSRTSWKFWQRSTEIIKALQKCLQKLKITEYNVKSCGVSATCSLAIFEKDKRNGSLIPYPNEDNVIFWMDSSAIDECKQLNAECSQQLLDFLGGSFVPEMGIPKLKYFLNEYSHNQDKQFHIFDLHQYIAYELSHLYQWKNEVLLKRENNKMVGVDGEASGWSPSFYENIMHLPSNVIIGSNGATCKKIASSAIVRSCIDSYASWFAVSSPHLETSLFMIAGTSTCYMYGTPITDIKIPGVWGPFDSVLDSNSHFSVYAAGQSCTGKLIEHLFVTHPCAKEILKRGADIYQVLERTIHDIEKQNGQSVHVLTKDIFFYGDYEGNRTPFADPRMKGSFIGETTDTSILNLIHKYICILEFLSFQTRLIIDTFKRQNIGMCIQELRISGSQAKNKRLLSLISLVNNGITINKPKDNIDLMGVRGAYLLAKSANEGKQIIDVIRERDTSDDNEKFEPLPEYQLLNDSSLLRRLLWAKYRIHLDMAKQQQRYHKLIDEVFSGTNFDNLPFSN
ncbi:Mpa43p [Saccharomyces cerevisiae x Saccharomyces kudriavzevii VIN7]|uniref:Mpa43p n=1 Tax=Saccharomyces cerevisiae x Saccharomyces kudriavzevii (strain VIN7) TaxID=1095631 RepID=H0H045_SACCK|nr:Mpa43p [Saccharomyces cerevisiae x Saccharomyces kudriavzevii VIN7]